MKREAGELAWLIKLTVAAGVLGAWLGAWAWIYWLAAGEYNNAGDWSLGEWLRWTTALLRTEYSVEVYTAAAAGAALFTAPLFYLFFKRS